jgi:hypothetical protein
VKIPGPPLSFSAKQASAYAFASKHAIKIMLAMNA